MTVIPSIGHNSLGSRYSSAVYLGGLVVTTVNCGYNSFWFSGYFSYLLSLSFFVPIFLVVFYHAGVMHDLQYTMGMPHVFDDTYMYIHIIYIHVHEACRFQIYMFVRGSSNMHKLNNVMIILFVTHTDIITDLKKLKAINCVFFMGFIISNVVG